MKIISLLALLLASSTSYANCTNFKSDLLYGAMKTDDVETVSKILKDPSVDLEGHPCDRRSKPILIEAILKNATKSVSVLLKNEKVQLNKLYSNQTALMVAIDEDNAAIVDLLLDSPRLDISVTNSSGQNALHLLAAESYDLTKQTIRALDRPGVHLNALDMDNESPIFKVRNEEVFAAFLNRTDVDITLLNSRGHSLLDRQCHNRFFNDQIVSIQEQLLRHPKFDPNRLDPEGNMYLERLFEGCFKDTRDLRNYNLRKISQLWLSNPRIDWNLKSAHGRTLVHSCLVKLHGSPFCFELLKDEKLINLPDAEGNTPIHYFMKLGYFNSSVPWTDDDFKFFLANKKLKPFLTNAAGKTAFETAKTPFEEMSFLKDVGTPTQKPHFNPNHTSKDGYSVLMYLLDGDSEAAKVFWDRQWAPGGDPRKNPFKNDWEIKQHRLKLLGDSKKYTQLVYLLRDTKVNVNALDDKGRSALHYALKSLSNPLSLKLLLSHPRLDLSIKDHSGNTALFAALSLFKRLDLCSDKIYSQMHMITSIVSEHFDLRERNKDGDTVFHTGLAYQCFKNLGIKNYKFDYGYLRELDSNGENPIMKVLFMKGEMSDWRYTRFFALNPEFNINTQNNLGETLLIKILKYSPLETVLERASELIIKREDVDLSLKDQENRSALDYAEILARENPKNLKFAELVELIKFRSDI